jgi:hypothetical protein
LLLPPRIILYLPVLALAAPRGEGEIFFLETGQFAQCNYPK